MLAARKSNVIELIKYDMHCVDNSKDPEYLFYTKSMLNRSITHYLMLKAEENIPVNFEKLCDEVNKRIGGRSTIYEVLQDGLNRGYFTKGEDDNDKRLRLYTLSEHYSNYLIKGLETCCERILQAG